MIRIRTIDHIVLRTAQKEKMIGFYCGVLGCTIERVLADDIGLSQLRAGDTLIDIISVDSRLGRAGGAAPSPEGNNLDHFCLQIEPLENDALVKYLADKGIEAGTFETRYGAQGFGPSLYIRDPDQNTIELKARLPL